MADPGCDPSPELLCLVSYPCGVLAVAIGKLAEADEDLCAISATAVLPMSSLLLLSFSLPNLRSRLRGAFSFLLCVDEEAEVLALDSKVVSVVTRTFSFTGSFLLEEGLVAVEGPFFPGGLPSASS